MTQKVAAQALPVVGALGGAAVNYAFIEHFQEVARVISWFAGSNESTAKTLYVRNMSALLRTPEAYFPCPHGGASCPAHHLMAHRRRQPADER